MSIYGSCAFFCDFGQGQIKETANLYLFHMVFHIDWRALVHLNPLVIMKPLHVNSV